MFFQLPPVKKLSTLKRSVRRVESVNKTEKLRKLDRSSSEPTGYKTFSKILEEAQKTAELSEEAEMSLTIHYTEHKIDKMV